MLDGSPSEIERHARNRMLGRVGLEIEQHVRSIEREKRLTPAEVIEILISVTLNRQIAARYAERAADDPTTNAAVNARRSS